MIDLKSIIDSNSINPKFLDENRRELHFRKTTLCPACEGIGSEVVMVFLGHTKGLSSEYKNCNFCNGTGRVLVETTIKFKPLEI